MEAIFDNCFKHSRKNILIDSSKDWIRPVYFRVLKRKYDVYVIHLIRNGRAVLYSGLKKEFKIHPDDKNTYNRNSDHISKIIKSWGN